MRNSEPRIAIISAQLGMARRWGHVIRDDITIHGHDLRRAPDAPAMRIRDDLAAQHEWQLDGHEGGVLTVAAGRHLADRHTDANTAIGADSACPLIAAHRPSPSDARL